MLNSENLFNIQPLKNFELLKSFLKGIFNSKTNQRNNIFFKYSKLNNS